MYPIPKQTVVPVQYKITGVLDLLYLDAWRNSSLLGFFFFLIIAFVRHHVISIWFSEEKMHMNGE